MVKVRLQKAKRLLDVQRSLQRLEEDRVTGLKGRQSELAAMQEEIVGALSGDEGLQGLFTPVIVRRLKVLSEESVRVGEELDRRSNALRALATRTKFAERLVRTYEQQHNRAMSDKELMDVIERLIRVDDASLP